MPSPIAIRSRQLKLTVTPEMHSRLVALAEKLGQTPATLGSMALSLYVTQQEANLGAPQRMVDNMISQLMPQILQQLVDTPEVEIKLPTLGAGNPDSLENRGPAGTVGVKP